jgi:hypothetical protein
MHAWGDSKQVNTVISLACAAVGREGENAPLNEDEPEAAVLLVACAIGLVTGGGVVIFNYTIHSMRHYVWQVKIHPPFHCNNMS